MRYFALLDFQHWILGFALGLVLLIAVYMTWRGYPRDRESIDDPFQELRPDFVPPSEHHPITPFLLFFHVGVAIWVVAYWVVIGIFGGGVY